MATNRYVDTANIPSGYGLTNLQTTFSSNSGSKIIKMYQTFAKAATDNDTSILRIFKGLSPGLIPITIKIACDAIAGLTAVDVGLYKTDVGAVVLDACFAATVNLAAGAQFAAAFDGFGALTHALLGQKLFEWAGHTVVTKLDAYDLCLTFDTGGANTGNISVLAEFAEG